MNTLKLIESIISFFDVGAVLESLKHYREQGLEMDLGEFMKILLLGKGYKELTPAQLSEKINSSHSDLVIIDLRETEKFQKDGISRAISDPFDDLLRGVLLDQKYTDDLDKEIMLICDTGQKSRVAGSILADEKFKHIYSIKGGMRRWNRWQRLVSGCEYQTCQKFSDS